MYLRLKFKAINEIQMKEIRKELKREAAENVERVTIVIMATMEERMERAFA